MVARLTRRTIELRPELLDELAAAIDAAGAAHGRLLAAAHAVNSEPFVRDLLDRVAGAGATNGLVALARSILDDHTRSASNASNIRSLAAQRELRASRSRAARTGGDSA